MSSDYSENRIRELEKELEEKSAVIEKCTDRIKELESELKFRTEYLTKKVDDITACYKKASSDYLEIQNSSSWRMTAGLRNTLTYFRDFFKNHIRIRVFFELVKVFISNGPESAAKKYDELNPMITCKELQDLGYDVTVEEINRQHGAQFRENYKISIITPVFNVSPQNLKATIESVEKQTYADWELLLFDESDERNKHVSSICEEYSRKDRRIKYKKLETGDEACRNYNAWIKAATGEFIALLDYNDLLHPYALFEAVSAIAETGADFVYTDEAFFHIIPKDAFAPVYKPDYAPDSLRSTNFIRRSAVFKRSLIGENGRFDPDYYGAWDYDLFLRLTEKAENIVHIPRILYYVKTNGRAETALTAVKPDALEAGRKVVKAHIERIGSIGDVSLITPDMPLYKVQYDIKDNSMVSILIPNCDHTDDLRNCIDSILAKTSYSNYEIVIIENNSTSDGVFDYYEQLQSEHDNIKVIVWGGSFNYSAINNFGAKHCSGDYYLLLNNDTSVITDDWIEQMLMYAQRDNVGAVGAKLLYPDDTIQHAGIGLGLFDLAGHLFRGAERNDPGYMGRLIYTQNVSAVTAACMMVRKDVWERVNGFDESFAVAFNDVDLCMRIRKAGYLIVWTPFSELYHYESKSRGFDDTEDKRKRFENEYFRFKRLWNKELAEGDPFFNPGISKCVENKEIINNDHGLSQS